MRNRFYRNLKMSKIFKMSKLPKINESLRSVYRKPKLILEKLDEMMI